MERQVWIVAFTGTIKAQVPEDIENYLFRPYEQTVYTYICMALAMHGQPLSLGYYPDDRPYPFPVHVEAN